LNVFQEIVKRHMQMIGALSMYPSAS